MSNNAQLISNCLSNKDLKNIVKMLERLPIDVANTYKKYRSVMEYEYIKNTLDHNYNYSNILDYLNNVAIPLIDDILDQPNEEAVLPISYETH